MHTLTTKKEVDFGTSRFASWLKNQRMRKEKLPDADWLRLESIEQEFRLANRRVSCDGYASQETASSPSQLTRAAAVQRSSSISRADAGDTCAASKEFSTALAGGAAPRTPAVSRASPPAYNVSKCMARTTGKKQCQRARARNSEFCAQHKKTAATGMLPYGRCDVPLRDEDTAIMARRTSKLGHGGKPVYYCRLTMWHFAAVEGVADLSELTDEQYTHC